MRHAFRAVAVTVVSASIACGGSSGEGLPPDKLDHDASAAFAGRWFGTLTVASGGRSQSTSTEMDVTVTGRNTLTFPGFCGDGGGPTARVTSDAAFTVASHSCSIPGSSCTVTWQIRGGSGSLSNGTIALSVDGPASGCNAPAGSSLTLQFAGTRSSAPAFSISFLFPGSVMAGAAEFLLEVHGLGFPRDAVVMWNGSPRGTTFVNDGLLRAQIRAADVASAGSALVTVTSGSAGTTSDPVTFQIFGPPVPVVLSILPQSAPVGSPGFTLQVSGSNLPSDSVVGWNGTPRATTFLNSTSLQAQIGAADVASAGTAQVTISSASSGTLATFAFQIVGPLPPVVFSLSPSSLLAGSPGFALQVSGTNFTTDAVVRWNGSSRPTTFVNPSFVEAQISAADIATAGSAQVAVSSASAGATSAPITFEILAPQAGVTILPLPARDMVWDPVRQRIYLSFDNLSPTNPNTITTLDPATATFDAGAFAGSQPNRLALSDDGQFIYAGVDGAAAVQRFTLPALVPDVRISLGSDRFFGAFHAGDLQVAPGAPRTIAISLFTSGVSPAAQGGVVIFDDTVARTTQAPGFGGTGFLFDSLQWGADASALYAANSEGSGFDFYALSVNASGVTVAHDFGGAFSSFVNRIHFDPVTRLVYSDDGHVIDPATGLPAGTYGASGLMIPDGSAGVAVFVTNDFGSATATVRTFDLTRFTPVGTFVVQNLSGSPTGRVLRWGSDGIAFMTSTGQVVLTHAPGLPRP